MNMHNEQGTVVGVFRIHDNARAAVNALKDHGFTDEQIGIASSHHHPADEGENYAGEGAAAGAATGAGLGALWGLGILAGVIPGIGPAIAGGTLAVLLSSAVAGAAAAGIAGALIGMGLSKEEAEYYESEMKAGRTIVTVHAGNRASEARALLHQYDGYDRMSAGDASGSGLGAGATGASSGDTSGVQTSTPNHMTGAVGPTDPADEDQWMGIQTTPVDGGGSHVREDQIREQERLEAERRQREHQSIDVPVTREEVSGEALGTGEDVAADDPRQQRSPRQPRE